MTNYVAMVRGVSPSTPPRNNASILKALETLGFANLASVLSSGNYVFSADATTTNELEEQIELAFIRELGLSLLTIVRSQQQIQQLVENNPLAAVYHGRGSYQLVTFFKQPVDLSLKLPYQPEDRAFQLIGSLDGALYTLTDNRVEETVSVMAWLEHRFTPDLTSRTPQSLQKILNKMSKFAG